MAIEKGSIGMDLDYREVLVKEIRAHKNYLKVAAITGLGLIGLGAIVSFSYSDLGILVSLIGMLRVLSGVYDLGRKDRLEKSLELIDEKTGLSRHSG